MLTVFKGSRATLTVSVVITIHGQIIFLILNQRHLIFLCVFHCIVITFHSLSFGYIIYIYVHVYTYHILTTRSNANKTLMCWKPTSCLSIKMAFLTLYINMRQVSIYTPRKQSLGGYIGFTLSVCLSA